MPYAEPPPHADARGPEKNVLCIARGARASLARVGQRKTPESRVGRDIRYISPLQPFSSTVHTHTATGWQGTGLASTSAKINMNYVPSFEEYIYSRVKQNIIHLWRETTISGNFVTNHDDTSELCTLNSISTYVGYRRAPYTSRAWTWHMYELPRSPSFSVRTAMMNDAVIERLSARTTDKPRGASERKSKLAASAAASFASSQHHEGGLLLLYLQNSRLICDIFRHCITRSSSNSPSRPRELTPALLCSPVPFHGAWLYGRAFTLPLLVSVPRQIRTPDFLNLSRMQLKEAKSKKARMSETRTGRWSGPSFIYVEHIIVRAPPVHARSSLSQNVLIKASAMLRLLWRARHNWLWRNCFDSRKCFFFMVRRHFQDQLSSRPRRIVALAKIKYAGSSRSRSSNGSSSSSSSKKRHRSSLATACRGDRASEYIYEKLEELLARARGKRRHNGSFGNRKNYQNSVNSPSLLYVAWTATYI
ncbi:unnamed protein product [Trichogramma brassicae]|uniref:Uncharacterized protein n=1 Tax=Trichogramma brassicae TaxID=86971 RepID=A0A6H5HRQ9_9HYME|nr:unnamed protein product [Trichogramma brassicae]